MQDIPITSGWRVARDVGAGPRPRVMPSTRARWALGIAGALVALVAGPGVMIAEAADPGSACRTSVVRAQLATGDPVEPLAANRLGAALR